MPTLVMESSPKFISCPDCGERYDNGRKRRLIDTCGHPRCYSCLFEDNPCPLCEKLPKQRTRTDSSVKTDSDENIDKSQQTGSGSLRKSKDYVGSGSHPNLSSLKEMHKNRSATLPHSFRQDSYFRSLYRYEPHGSTENLSSSRSSSSPTPRPKSMPPSYHKSLENLHEQFWKSVQLAERKWSPDKSSKKNGDEETPSEEEKSKTCSPAPASPPPEIVDCPAPNVVRLPVPSSAHPRPPRLLYHHLTAEERMNELRQEISRKAQEQKEASRPRSCSDILQPQSVKNIKNDVIDLGTTTSTRPQSWSHIQFPPTSAQVIPNDYRSSSSLSDRSYDSRNSSCSSPPNSWSPTLHRSASPQYYSSDKSSDVSSIHLSDTCSVSSGDSDSIHSGIRSPSSNRNERVFSISRPHSALENYSSGSSPTQPPRRFPVNPLANVTYWVVDSGEKSLDTQPELKETNLDDVIRTRPSNNGATHAQTPWNGQTKRSPTTVINVQTEVSTL